MRADWDARSDGQDEIGECGYNSFCLSRFSETSAPNGQVLER